MLFAIRGISHLKKINFITSRKVGGKKNLFPLPCPWHWMDIVWEEINDLFHIFQGGKEQ